MSFTWHFILTNVIKINFVVFIISSGGWVEWGTIWLKWLKVCDHSGDELNKAHWNALIYVFSLSLSSSSLYSMVGIRRWQIPTIIITVKTPPWWDFDWWEYAGEPWWWWWCGGGGARGGGWCWWGKEGDLQLPRLGGFPCSPLAPFPKNVDHLVQE